MSSPNDGVVVITLADIYKQMVELTTRVDSSLARQDQADRILAEHEADLRPLSGAAEKLVDHEARLRTIERSRWPLTSVTVVLAAGSLAVAVAALLGHH